MEETLLRGLILSQQQYITKLESDLNNPKKIWVLFVKNFVMDTMDKLNYTYAHDNCGSVYDGKGRCVRFYKNYIEISYYENAINYAKFYYDLHHVTMYTNGKGINRSNMNESEWFSAIYRALSI